MREISFISAIFRKTNRLEMYSSSFSVDEGLALWLVNKNTKKSILGNKS